MDVRESKGPRQARPGTISSEIRQPQEETLAETRSRDPGRLASRRTIDECAAGGISRTTGGRAGVRALAGRLPRADALRCRRRVDGRRGQTAAQGRRERRRPGVTLATTTVRRKPAVTPDMPEAAGCSGPRWPLRRRWPDGGDGAGEGPSPTESVVTASLEAGTSAPLHVHLVPGP